MEYPNKDQAYIGLLIESNWDEIREYFANNHPPNIDIDLEEFDPALSGYTIIDYREIENTAGNPTLKCIALMDSEGNIHVHFSGTGDGNWAYNIAAYDKEPSKIQVDSADFLRKLLEEYGGSDAEIHLTGHSQGGNTAQYVALAVGPALGKYITSITSLDGPGFSEQVIQSLIDKFGEAFFYEQIEKMYAYHGNNDYVHVLGEKSIIPADHQYMIKTGETGYKMGENNVFIIGHMANYMLNPDGSFRDECLPYDEAVAAGWRGTMQITSIALNENFMKLLPEQIQVAFGLLVMASVEQITNNGDDQIVNGEFGEAILAFFAAIPGCDAVLNGLATVFANRNITSTEELWAYISADPLNNTMDLVLSLLTDPNALLGMVQMGATIKLLAVLATVVLALLKIAITVAVPIILAVLVVSLIVEFLVQVWDTLVATGKLVAEYVTKIAQDIYNHVCNQIEIAIDTTLKTVEFMCTKAKELAKKTYTQAVAFVQYAKTCIKEAFQMACSFANQVARAVTGAVQNIVTINVELLQSCVDRLDSLASRVLAMDRRLDDLFIRLLNDLIEGEEGIFISLANLYNITSADLNVDEGNRLRRMADNINNWNIAYKAVESWLMGLL